MKFDELFYTAMEVVKLSDKDEYERLMLIVKRIKEEPFMYEMSRDSEAVDLFSESELFKKALVIIATSGKSFRDLVKP